MRLTAQHLIILRICHARDKISVNRLYQYLQHQPPRVQNIFCLNFTRRNLLFLLHYLEKSRTISIDRTVATKDRYSISITEGGKAVLDLERSFDVIPEPNLF